ncbi:MAG: PDZ domain-containing protein [Gemmataceae bacterium]
MTVLCRYLASAATAVAMIAPVHAQPSGTGGSKLLAPFQSVVAKANSATVRVMCDDKDAALGTIVTSEGLILTKASELRGAISVKLADGSVLDAEITSVHKETDLALIKIDMKGLKPVAFDDSKQVPTGSWLAAAGTAANPTAVGIVSVMTRDLSGFDARDMLNQNRGYLGIMLGKEDDAKGGAKVDGFPADGTMSGAQKAGLKKGDTIYEVNGKRIAGSDDLRELLSNYKPGEKVKVKVRRAAEELDFTITLGKPAPQRSDIQNAMGGELSGRRTGFPTILQTDMILDPKNIGGPVVDLDGHVLGISIARAGRVETWILPSETIRPLLADMRAGKFPPFTPKAPKLPVAPPPRSKPAKKAS